jgi:predicted  nucleic acid-binding Zn-ribbon protein
MADDFETILAIQDLDTAADVLRHRRESLPERADLAARHEALAAIEADLEPTRDERHRVERAQKALEDDLAILAEKRAAVEAQMYGGGSSNAKELQAFQDELNAFDRRRAVLEEGILERMVELEPLDATLDATLEQRSSLDEEAVALTARLAEAEADIDRELADIERRRSPLTDAVDSALLSRYERLRTRLQGVGVARLDGTRCTGCHLALPAAEVEAVRRQARDEGIAECPECERLLVV